MEKSTFKIKLTPFDYYDASKFYPNMTDEDKVRLYSIFGGVPFYTNKIDDTKSLKENIIDLIIDKGAIFESETNYFLTQEVRSISSYGKILMAIANGATKLTEITTKSGTSNTGTTSKYLDVLSTLGIIEKEYCFSESRNSKKTIYKIKDQHFNFHYTYIEKNITRKEIMNSSTFYDQIVAPYLDEFVSFEFENVCREYLIRTNRLTIQEIGRYWYNDAKQKKNIEIDIIMKNNDLLYAYECKWTNTKIDAKIVSILKYRTQIFNSIQLGLFSKSGYDENLDDKSLHLYNFSDLYYVSSYQE